MKGGLIRGGGGPEGGEGEAAVKAKDEGKGIIVRWLIARVRITVCSVDDGSKDDRSASCNSLGGDRRLLQSITRC